MFRFLCRKQCPVSRISSSWSSNTEDSSTIHFCFVRSSLLKFISHSSKSSEKSSFTVSYLIESCGLPPETAISASKKIKLKSKERADSVVLFLRNSGLSKTHIANLITKFPKMLFCIPEKTLKPKIDFFHDIGISGTMLGKILCANPSLLRRSLKNQLQPSLDFLKGFVGAEVVNALRRSTQVLQSNLQNLLIPNIEILRAHGVPHHRIVKLMIFHPRVLSRCSNQFRKIVTKIKEMGFNPINSIFILGVRAKSVMSESTWERKVKVYKSVGWSEDDIYLAFRKQPMCMIISEEKIIRVMDFLVNTLCCKPSTVARCPNLLLLSLDRRIIPRCWVICTLMSNNLIEKDVTLAWLLIMTEKNFLEKFVIKHQHKIPALLETYQGNMGPVELNLESEQLDKIKLL